MTKTAAFSLAAAAVLGLGAFAASAQAEQRVIVEKNHVVRVALPAAAGSVIVGDPDIADVTVIDSRTIFITGHGFGNSSIAVTDRNGHTIFDGEIVVTSITQGGITVYKGLTATRMVCSTVCVADENPSTAEQSASSAPAGSTAGLASLAPTISTGAGNVATQMVAAAGKP